MFQVSSRALTWDCLIVLQNLRLTCRKFTVIVTPFLFESMVLDEKFQERNQLTRAMDFAEQCPALAACVKQLQLKIAPMVRKPLKLEYSSMPKPFVQWAYIDAWKPVQKKKKRELPLNSPLYNQLKTWVVNPRARDEAWMDERPMNFMVRS